MPINKPFGRRIVMKLLMFLFIAGAMATVVVLANCQRLKQTVQPVAIEPNDMCSYCKMSISEKRYAAEFIDSENQDFKFDDIGCMTNFLSQKKEPAAIRGTFVMDYQHPVWIKAENAFYVRSSEFHTPMNGGIVAFGDETSARGAAAKYHGTLLRFEEVMK